MIKLAGRRIQRENQLTRTWKDCVGAGRGGMTRRWWLPEPYSLFDYYLTSIYVGLRALTSCYRREAAARIVNPLSYTRYMEYDLALRELGPLDNLRVLDIGSPKLPVLLLARHEHCDLFITDIRDYFIGPSEVFLKKLGKEKSLGENLHLEVQDARSMTYSDESFDRIFSISVIEHIEDSGDTDAMLEIYRILKPGGIVTITLPFSSKGYFEEYYHWDPYERKHLEEPKFYQRWYDTTSLHERIIGPSGLRVVSTTFFGEPGLKFQPYWNQIPMRWKIPALFLQPFLAQLLLKRIDPDRLDAACGIAFKLQKPYHEDAAAPNGVRSEKSQ